MTIQKPVQHAVVVHHFLFNKMLIATWNINSVRIRLQIIEGWIQERNPDIILLQEIKCENDSFPKSFFENLGYVCQINGEKGKNGVAILIKKSCHLGNYSVSNFDFNKSSQARVIELNFDNRLYILSLYAPNGNPITDKTKFCLKNLWYKNLFKYTRNLFNNESDIILGGDFNVLEGENDVLDIKNWKNDALGCDETIYNFRKVLSNGFTNVVRIFKDQKNCFSFWDYQNSSWERNYGLLIDHFLVSPRMIERTKEFGIDSHIRGHEKPSDHVPVWINLNI